jgi:hypothetical protein
MQTATERRTKGHRYKESYCTKGHMPVATGFLSRTVRLAKSRTEGRILVTSNRCLAASMHSVSRRKEGNWSKSFIFARSWILQHGSGHLLSIAWHACKRFLFFHCRKSLVIVFSCVFHLSYCLQIFWVSGGL